MKYTNEKIVLEKIKLSYAQDILTMIKEDKGIINYLCDFFDMDCHNFLNMLKDIDNTNIGFYDEVYVLASKKMYSKNIFR